MRISLPRDVKSHNFDMTFNRHTNHCSYINDKNGNTRVLAINGPQTLLSLVRLNENGDYSIIETNVSKGRTTKTTLKSGNINSLPTNTRQIILKATNNVYSKYRSRPTKTTRRSK